MNVRCRGSYCTDHVVILSYPDGNNFTLINGGLGGNCLANTTFLSSNCAEAATARVVYSYSSAPYNGFIVSGLSALPSPGAAAGTYTLTVGDKCSGGPTKLVDAKLSFFEGEYWH